jgi:large subunit ribosomal protein L10
MPNLVNRIVVRELTAELAGADAVLLVSFAGLTVAESEALRDQLAEKGARFRMVRNVLARRVFAERGLEFAGDALAGNTAVAYGSVESVLGAAKILTSSEVKKAGKVRLKAGVLEDAALGAADVAALASMPDRNTLNAQLLGCISGPARGLVGALNALPASFARVLQARADQLQSAAGAS